MNKYIIGILLLFITIWNANAQQGELTGEEIIRGGLLKIAGNIGVGFQFKPSLTNIYVAGNIEGYLNKRVSLRGDLAFLVGTQKAAKVLEHNHSIFWGAAYHMPFKKLDFFVGLQPGVSFVQGYRTDSVTLSTPKAVPVISAIAGINYYFSRYFHFYLATRFVAGQYFGEGANPVSMTELRLELGLGFHINAVKRKKPDSETSTFN